MSRIGTLANARKAEAMYDSCTLAEGWSIIGEGSYRVAYLAPDGFVYKVQHDTDSWGGEPSENEQEWMNFRAFAQTISEMSEGRCRLAASRYFKALNVIAMEYVPCAEKAFDDNNWDNGYAGYVSKDVYKLAKHFHKCDIYDQGEFNIWFDADGILTMIDYAG